MSSVPARVAEIPRRHPERVAIVGDDRRIHYAAFWDEARRFARGLRARGQAEGAQQGDGNQAGHQGHPVEPRRGRWRKEVPILAHGDGRPA